VTAPALPILVCAGLGCVRNFGDARHSIVRFSHSGALPRLRLTQAACGRSLGAAKHARTRTRTRTRTRIRTRTRTRIRIRIRTRTRTRIRTHALTHARAGKRLHHQRRCDRHARRASSRRQVAALGGWFAGALRA